MRLIAGAFLALALLASVVAADQKGSTTEWNMHKENFYLPAIACSVGALFVGFFLFSIFATVAKSHGRRVAYYAMMAALMVTFGYGSQIGKMFPYEREITNNGPPPFATETIYPTYWWFKVPASFLITISAASFALTGERNSMMAARYSLVAAFAFLGVLYGSWGNWRWFFAVCSGTFSAMGVVFAASQMKRMDILGVPVAMMYAVFPFLYQMLVMFGPYWFQTYETLWNQTMAHMFVDFVVYGALPAVMCWTAINKADYAKLSPGSRADTTPNYVQTDDPTVISGNGPNGHPAFIASERGSLLADSIAQNL